MPMASKSTTSLAYHLKHKHRIFEETQQECSQAPRGKQPKLKDVGVRPPISKKRQTFFSELVTEMIAGDLHSVNMVKGRGFRKLMRHAVPGFVIPHPSTIMRTYVPKLKNKVRGRVQDELKEAIHITYTTDVWTDNFLHNSYMCITAHYITADWKMKSYVLCTVIMKGSITGVALKKVLESTMADWKLDGITRSLVSDQGANILRAGRLANWHHMTCFAHKLNLCITKYGLDAVPAYKGLIKKCKDIVEFLRYKGPEVTEKQNQLRHFVKNFVENDHSYQDVTYEVGSTSVKRHNKTRWNSICIMVDSIAKNGAVICSLLRDYERDDLILKSTEMRALKKLLAFLVPFKLHCESMQGEKYPTLSQVWPSVCLLRQKCIRVPREASESHQSDNSEDDEHYLEAGVDYRKALSDLKDAVLKAIDKKFPKSAEYDICRLATSLDIRFRGMPDVYQTVADMEMGIKKFLESIGGDMAQYSKLSGSTHQSPPPKSNGSKFSDLWGPLLDTETDDIPETDLTTELRSYLILPRLTPSALDEFKLLTWWKDHETMFPLLSKLCRKIHSVVATSAPSERIFSTGGNIVTQKRSSLLPSNVDSFIFLHTNLYKDGEEDETLFFDEE